MDLIWVNYHISLFHVISRLNIYGPFWDDSPKINHDSSEGEQWGRYNLPRSYVCMYIYILLYGNLKIHIWKSSKIMIFANFRKCYKNAAPKKRRIERWLGSQATHFLHSVRQSKCPPQLSAKNMINLAKNNIPLDFNCFRDPNRKGEFGTQIQTVRNDLHDKSSENLRTIGMRL